MYIFWDILDKTAVSTILVIDFHNNEQYYLYIPFL